MWKVMGGQVSTLALLFQIVWPTLVFASEFYSIDPTVKCADQCTSLGRNSVSWSTFPLAGYFEDCTWDPALFTYNLTANGIISTKINACVDFGEDLPPINRTWMLQSRIAGIEIDVETSFEISQDPIRVVPAQAEFSGLLIQGSLLRGERSNTTHVNGIAVHAHYGNTVVGIWVGNDFDKREFATSILEDFINVVRDRGIGQTLQTQLCSKNGTSLATSTFGIIADTSSGIKSFSRVRNAVSAWSEGHCAEIFKAERSPAKMDSQMRILQADENPSNWTKNAKQRYLSSTTNISVPKNHTSNSIEFKLGAPNFCRTVDVKPGDFCYALAEKCQITFEDFQKFNPKPGVCNIIQAGQKFCCSEGGMPDIKPKRGPDGSCTSYYVVEGDTCGKLAANNDLTVEEIERFNRDTWGWNGCDGLQAKYTMCLSEGTPPFPAVNPKAVCGPTKPGTVPHGTNSRTWANLNHCPLNACCNIHGQCGTTDDFCIDKSMGAPGSSRGPNGCVSNCGSVITNNSKRPAEYRKIGYFEAWNTKRKCLHMDCTEIPSGVYTHIHFAFPDITQDYRVDIARVKSQFEKFVKMTGFKKIVAFGGWAFSTEIETHQILRNGVRAGARETLAANLADFVLRYNLDGIDIDWEYPGVPDMNWLPKSSPDEGPNYVEFLKLLRAKLPNKSISIAAPASFWYLKAFPIEKIANVVDYIVYMTYDLHGQWDYDNKWAVPDCEKGNCLRSHIGMMETYNSLSMITKAGVPTHKIVVGVSSYGRQFKMTDPGCTGKHCTFVGPKSTATKGRCTDTAEYISNAEIKEITQKNPGAKVIANNDDSKTLIYDGNWVSWMDDQDKIARTNLYKALNMGGTVDWAIDLIQFSKAELSGTLINYLDDPILGRGGCKAANWGGMRGGGNWANCEKRSGATPASCEDDESWRSVDCTNPGITQFTDPAYVMWKNVKAQAAWCSAVKNWTAVRSETQRDTSFPQYISEWLRGRPDFFCEILAKDRASNGCLELDGCRDQRQGTAASLQHITRSMVNIYENLRNMWTGLEGTQLSSRSALDQFVKDFLPRKDKTLDIILNILAAVASMGSAGYFNSFLKQSAWGVSNKVFTDNLKDLSGQIAAMGMNFGKDANKAQSEREYADLQEQVRGIFDISIQGWRYALEEIDKAIFSGDDRSLAMLTEMLKDGNSLKRKPLGVKDVEVPAAKLMYSMLILNTWRMQDYWPVLLDTGKDCKDTGVGTGKNGWAKPQDLTGLARVCRENRQYHILATRFTYGCNAKNSAGGTGGFGQINCNELMSVPPGMKKIRMNDGIELYGRLNLYTMIDSAWNAYTVFKGNRKFTDTDIHDSEFVHMMVNSLEGGTDISMIPGLIDIPICGWNEIKANWRNGPKKDNPNYPCNK